jgi:hypothetical protein
MGSAQDRVMREMVFRERQEKVAQVQAIARIVAQVFGLDADRVFGSVVAEYASEVFQETYDPELLRRKLAALRVAQARVKRHKDHDLTQLTRLEKMGAFYDREFGNDLGSGRPRHDRKG